MLRHGRFAGARGAADQQRCPAQLLTYHRPLLYSVWGISALGVGNIRFPAASTLLSADPKLIARSHSEPLTRSQPVLFAITDSLKRQSQVESDTTPFCHSRLAAHEPRGAGPRS